MNKKNLCFLILVAVCLSFSWSQWGSGLSHPGESLGPYESLCICQDGFGGASIISAERNEAGEIFHKLYRRKSDGGDPSFFDEEFCLEESFDLALGEIRCVRSYERDFYDFFILETGREYFYILFCSHKGQWNLNRVEGRGGRISSVDASGFSTERPAIFFESEKCLWMCIVDEKLFPVSITRVSSSGEDVSAFKAFRGTGCIMGLYTYSLQEKSRLCFFTYDGGFRCIHEDVDDIKEQFDFVSSACIEDRESGTVYICSSRGNIFISGNTFGILPDGKAIDGFNVDVHHVLKSELAFLGESYRFDSGKVFHERNGFDDEVIDNVRLFVRTSIVNCLYYCAFAKDEQVFMYKAGITGGFGR